MDCLVDAITRCLTKPDYRPLPTPPQMLMNCTEDCDPSDIEHFPHNYCCQQVLEIVDMLLVILTVEGGRENVDSWYRLCD